MTQTTTDSNSNDPAASTQMIWLGRWTALMAVALLGATWPLWLGLSEFPAIPLTLLLRAVPIWVDWIAVGGLLLGLSGVVLAWAAIPRWAWPLVLVCGLTLVANDQHRLQPWFYQLLFFAAILRLSQPPHARTLLTWIAISIYFYSALGKFDFEFLHTVGQQFWGGMTRIVGGAAAIDHETPIVWIALLPLAELMLAVGLSWRMTRRATGVVACLFHVGLMLLLGPLGLEHSWGVFLWNLQFAVQALLLFSWPQIQSRSPEHEGLQHNWGNRLATGLATLVILLPVGERWGHWDHWTSWALYAPHSSRVEVWVANSAVDKLPTGLRSLTTPNTNDALWIRLPLERWSLEETATPIYPQARFEMGVALEMARRIDSEHHIQVVLRGVSARWDGQRTSTEYQGTQAIVRAAHDNFWLNTQPRQHY